MKTNKSQKVIISILAVLIVAAGIFVGVLVYIRNIPQLKIWNAFKNTMLTAEESQAEAKYGGYDMIKAIRVIIFSLIIRGHLKRIFHQLHLPLYSSLLQV